MESLRMARVKAEHGRYVDKGYSFSVMINPASMKHGQSIHYHPARAMGQPASSPKYYTQSPDTLSFEVVLDGTGVVPRGEGRRGRVATQIKELRRVVYDYEGPASETDAVRIIWGTFQFYGRLQTLSVDYTLFKSSGEPLRAKVALSFLGSVSRKQADLMAGQDAKQASQQVTVKAGDTLPLLSQTVYGDAGRYADVARLNNLTSLRDLEPGTVLVFPPIQ